jgi:hypothetical protein
MLELTAARQDDVRRVALAVEVRQERAEADE